MGIRLENHDLVIECSICNQELDRLDSSNIYPRMFKKPFSIVCMECMKTAEGNFNSILILTHALKSVFYTK